MKTSIRSPNDSEETLCSIEAALRERDGTRLVAMAARARDRIQYFDQLRNSTFHAHGPVVQDGPAVGRPQEERRYSSLFMWPVILDRRLLTGAGGVHDALSGESTQLVVQQLEELSGKNASIALMHALFGYNMVCCSGPVVLRQLFEQLSQLRLHIEMPLDEDEHLAIERFPYGVPDDAPVLCFLMGAMTRKVTWPQLDLASAQTTVDANHYLASTLRLDLAQTPQAMELELHTLAPAPAAQAIESGVIEWLTVLSRRYNFTHWVVLDQGDDRLDLLIELNSGAIPSIQVPLRMHQMGVNGVERVMAYVNSLVAAKSISVAEMGDPMCSEF